MVPRKISLKVKINDSKHDCFLILKKACCASSITIFFSVHGKSVVEVEVPFKIDLIEYINSKHDYMVSSTENVNNSAHILSKKMKGILLCCLLEMP